MVQSVEDSLQRQGSMVLEKLMVVVVAWEPWVVVMALQRNWEW